MTDIHSERRQRLAAIARSQGLGAIAFVPGANFSYVSGLHFHLMERPTLLFVTADNQIVAIVPELERAKWNATFPDAQTYFWQDSDGYQDAFAAASDALKGQMIGVEGMRMRVFEGDALRRHFQQGAIVDVESDLRLLRQAKSSAEIVSLHRAIDISELALSETLAEVKAGMSERQILNLLKALQRKHQLAYIFISHDLGVVRALCHQVMVLRQGEVVEQGECKSVFSAPRHEYTRQLLALS